MIGSHNTLDISLIRRARKKRQSMPTMLGDMVDSYEAQLNDLQLQMALLTSQSEIERQKAEILATQITNQVRMAEADIIKFLNQYSKALVDQVSAQVTISEESLKFKNSDLYDLSFINNMDYSKIVISNDNSLLQNRVDNREVFRQQMINMKSEVTFQQGLIKNTREDDSMMPNLYNARNYFLREYYLACIAFYQEATIIGFLYNPTNNISNLKEFIDLNNTNIPIQKTNLEAKRVSIGEAAYAQELSRIQYTERMLITATYRLKYLQMAYAGKWVPPTFQTLTDYAEKNNITYSRAVYELNDKARSTLCVPDWVLAIAEMYNQIATLEQGSAIVPLNPYDPIWIRKAREVIDMDSIGVKNTAEKLFKSIDKYWEVLTGGFQSLEDFHVDAILIKAANVDNTPVVGYEISTDYDLVSFDEDQQTMNGFFTKVWHGVSSVASAIVTPMVRVAGLILVAASPVTKIAAGALKFSLDNTLGRVLPDSIYKKISGLTNAGAAILEGNLTTANFRAVVKGVMDYALIGNRILDEAVRQAQKVGFVRSLDKLSGGLLTSVQHLNKAPVTLETGGKINWAATLVDALKVYVAIATMGTGTAILMATNVVGQETGLNKNPWAMGVLNAGALMAAGQIDFTQAAIGGAEQVGTKTVINNTALGQTELGRSVAVIGVDASIGSIFSNNSFADIAKNVAVSQLKAVAVKEAVKALTPKPPPRKIPAKRVIVKRVVTSTSSGVRTSFVSTATSNGVPLSDNTILSDYETIDQIIQEAKDYYTSEKVNLGNVTLDAATINKLSAEADHVILKRMDEVYGFSSLYGEQLATYLLVKYGTMEDYGKIIIPDDYLNFQKSNYKTTDRLTNIDYTKGVVSSKAILGIAGGLGLLAFLAIDK